MPVPFGATARNLHDISRWTLLVLLALAPLTLWWPTFNGWTAWIVGVLAVWAVWMCWRIVERRIDVPGHVLHLALLGVLAVQGYHLARTGLEAQGPPERFALSGQVDVSLVLQVAVLALAAMLAQDLLGSAGWPAARLTAMGTAVAAGALLALCCQPAIRGRTMLGLMGWTGVAMLLAPLWRLSRPPEQEQEGPGAGRLRRLRAGCVSAALLAAVALVPLCPLSLPVVALAGATTLLLSALCLHKARWQLLLAGLGLLVGLGVLVFAVARSWGVDWISPLPLPEGLRGWLGGGEAALGETWWSWDHGLGLLVGAAGWVGALWLIGGLVVSLAWAMWHTRRSQRDDWRRAILWIFTASLATAALLAPGGLFCPAINAVFALTWGILPAMLGQEVPRHSGWWMLGPLLLLGLMFGLARHDGLLTWAAISLGSGPFLLHVATGWLVTQVLLWLMGRTRWGAVLAVAGSVGAALAGEVGQFLIATGRHAEWGDVMAHTIGATGALVLYLLCRASLWCELPPPRSGRGIDREAQVS